MSPPDSELDKHLRALFGDLDTRADFDARLMARLRAESPTDTTERGRRAQLERARYRRAVSGLQSWRRSTLRLLTLDTSGIALVLGVAVVTAWPRISAGVMDVSRQYSPYIAILLSVLVAAVPLLGMWAEQTRRPIRLL